MIIDLPGQFKAPDNAAREELLRGPEALSGRRIRSRQDVEAFMRERANPPARTPL